MLVERRFVFLHQILFVKCLKLGWTYLPKSPCTSDVGQILRFLLHALSLEVLATQPAYKFWCVWSDGDQSTGHVQCHFAVWLQHVINQLQIFNNWTTCKRFRTYWSIFPKDACIIRASQDGPHLSQDRQFCTLRARDSAEEKSNELWLATWVAWMCVPATGSSTLACNHHRRNTPVICIYIYISTYICIWLYMYIPEALQGPNTKAPGLRFSFSAPPADGRGLWIGIFSRKFRESYAKERAKVKVHVEGGGPVNFAKKICPKKGFRDASCMFKGLPRSDPWFSGAIWQVVSESS